MTEQDEDRELTAKTVDEAIEIATLEFGVGRDEIEIDVLSAGRQGILGIGAEPARIRARRIQADATNAGTALKVVSHLLKELGVDALPTIRSSGAETEAAAIIDIRGADAGLLIGHRGETLQAFQYVVNLVLSGQGERQAPVVLDVEEYRDRRRRSLGSRAQSIARRVATTGKAATLEPMSAADRRAVHMALSNDRSVTTESSGEGRDRRVTIKPTGRQADIPGGRWSRRGAP